jgi:predicted nucleic acid-binding protein
VTLVFNASPVIVLAKAGLLDCFTLLGDPSLLPQEVADEISAVDDPLDPARLYLGRRSPSLRVEGPIPISPLLAAWDLGKGESSVISLTLNQAGAVAVLDDLQARRCALAHGIQMTGTLGLVLLAKKRGIIPEVREALHLITAAGLYISPGILEEILVRAGE